MTPVDRTPVRGMPQAPGSLPVSVATPDTHPDPVPQHSTPGFPSVYFCADRQAWYVAVGADPLHDASGALLTWYSFSEAYRHCEGVRGGQRA